MWGSTPPARTLWSWRSRKTVTTVEFFTDWTADVADDLSYSQHCQVFAVLSGASDAANPTQLLLDAFDPPAKGKTLTKCSYVLKFYAFRAFAKAGPEVYDRLYPSAWEPWRLMLKNNLSTLEEDDVRKRSDCHAWGAVPIYEYCVEVAGISPIEPGFRKVSFAPRVGLSEELRCEVALGKGNLATVSWGMVDGEKKVRLRLKEVVAVVSRSPGEEEREHGQIKELDLVYKGA